MHCGRSYMQDWSKIKMVQIKYSHLAFWNTTLRDVCSYIWGGWNGEVSKSFPAEKSFRNKLF